MGKKLVTLVARDAAPSQAFSLIADALGAAGIDAALLVGRGKSFELDVKAVGSADLVLVGISAPAKNAEEELAALRIACDNGIPYGLFADTFGAWTRPWFANYQSSASLLFVVNATEAAEAQRFYPIGAIQATGNPVWEEFFYPRMSREEARAKMGANQDETVVLVPGGKETALNCALWMGVIEAIKSLGGDDVETRRWRIICSLHPGDKTSADVYQRIVDLAPAELKPVFLDKSKISTDDAVAGADLVVDNRTHVGLRAVSLRIPVVSADSLFHANRAQMMFGSADWPPIQAGATARVISSIGTTSVIPHWSCSYPRVRSEKSSSPPRRRCSLGPPSAGRRPD